MRQLRKRDIICIVETWLDNVITDYEVDLPDYQFRFDCCGRGGGIAIYVRTFQSCKVLFQGGPFALEFLSLSITCQPFCMFCLCLFYRPPSSPVSIFDNFCTTLHILNPAKFHRFCDHR